MDSGKLVRRDSQVATFDTTRLLSTRTEQSQFRRQSSSSSRPSERGMVTLSMVSGGNVDEISATSGRSIGWVRGSRTAQNPRDGPCPRASLLPRGANRAPRVHQRLRAESDGLLPRYDYVMARPASAEHLRVAARSGYGRVLAACNGWNVIRSSCRFLLKKLSLKGCFLLAKNP